MGRDVTTGATTDRETWPDPRSLRAAIAAGEWDGALDTVPHGYTQSTVVIMPRRYASDFHAFCQRNARACGLLWMSAAGDPEIGPLAPGGDIRRDLYSYRVWKDGVHVGTVADVTSLWRDDLVSFYLGCSLTFEQALDNAGVARKAGRIYTTGLPCEPVGDFSASLSVTMRAMTPANAIRAIQVTGRFPATHGAPIHFGDPGAIGVSDLAAPDFGPPADVAEGEVPVFWACSATAVAAAEAARPDLLITFDPPYMLVTDRLVEETAVF
ncbi:DUF1445 domain-containing protein [Spirillospora sp. NPDC029432]|uniref:D-glutamate cyclase family protein n=1 Tax=Spirillospora sp. NPDC029432 TaxID=3154599 RepID=UPI0034555F61